MRTSYLTTCDVPACQILEAALTAAGYSVVLDRDRQLRPGVYLREWETTCPAAELPTIAARAGVPLYGVPCDLTKTSGWEPPHPAAM